MTNELSTDFADATGAALVVGGSGGLGAAIAEMLAARGSDVAVTYRSNKDAGESVAAAAAKHGVRTSAHALDVTSAEACSSVLAEVATVYGGIHTLVYASGPHVPMVHLSKVSPADFAEQLTQDAVGFFNVVHPSLARLRETKGSIVAVTTAATARFPVRDGLSSAPKGAVEQLVRGIAAEEGRFGIRINAVGPGMLTDGMAARLIESGELDDNALAITRNNIPLRRFGNAADIAEAVCFLASDRAGFITGQKLDIDGGYTV
ncbi:NAD(P)-dependent dehydrogenase (short-subunit alcohol dehydrogenase family) [Aeromicrobium panaciterrae]|uniref:NAD(P)-dependent dehydrogenase (Short-subunit alcohol dehydrogenase family) n=1 Tax=Aeromicrobium panaciterrae TaxID=363861 RepID=A0ABU1UL45_9ACTN|nr:SDR family oxidoreductase [Aeromicrobium panaciterrae]MDR7085896.1 NAD(P)-dependent dehydrogenase (short-subunit alcohol dehydrogenase family) [Aeromicrobium panaciterrae]